MKFLFQGSNVTNQPPAYALAPPPPYVYDPPAPTKKWTEDEMRHNFDGKNDGRVGSRGSMYNLY